METLGVTHLEVVTLLIIVDYQWYIGAIETHVKAK